MSRSLGVRERVVVHRGAPPRHLRDRGLELHHVDALHARHGGQPAGGAAGAEADDQGAPGCGCSSAPSRPAITCVPASPRALPSALPLTTKARPVEPSRGRRSLSTPSASQITARRCSRSQSVSFGPARSRGLRPPRADRAVAPGRRGPGRGEQRQRRRRAIAAGGEPGERAPSRASHAATSPRTRSSAATSRQQPGAVSSGRRPKPAGERAERSRRRCSRRRPSRRAAHVLAAAAEERDQQRELRPGHEGRRERRRGRPPRHPSTWPAKARSPSGRSTSARSARRSPSAKRPPTASASSRQVAAKARSVAGRSRADERVGEAAQADAEERHGQDQAEGEDGAAEQGRQHPVPDELHQEEGEADERAGGEDEAARGAAGPAARGGRTRPPARRRSRARPRGRGARRRRPRRGSPRTR